MINLDQDLTQNGQFVLIYLTIIQQYRVYLNNEQISDSNICNIIYRFMYDLKEILCTDNYVPL